MAAGTPRPNRFTIHLCALACMAQPIFAPVAAQFVVRGDTMGAPRGCSAASGIMALSKFVEAYNTADSARLVQAMVTPAFGRFVFSIGKFTRSDSFARANSPSELIAFARKRRRNHERMVIRQVRFNRWRGQDLNFGPLYLWRVADDLGGVPLRGIAKGAYRCGRGISVLNVAPQPRDDTSLR